MGSVVLYTFSPVQYFAAAAVSRGLYVLYSKFSPYSTKGNVFVHLVRTREICVEPCCFVQYYGKGSFGVGLFFLSFSSLYT